ncbi:hypothetical protein BDY21DRAFT_422765 [Lineolata rhizophorae]|uniref:Uncharacterized protein n=1 Tax=Lineolata rhizophorae TaxID=578093 RepID=A0A6A6NW92_9PEZI|nr:hypothetical protein BDY21DRAFT_422765 [Lineolata rhizophorae]
MSFVGALVLRGCGRQAPAQLAGTGRVRLLLGAHSRGRAGKTRATGRIKRHRRDMRGMLRGWGSWIGSPASYLSVMMADRSERQVLGTCVVHSPHHLFSFERDKVEDNPPSSWRLMMIDADVDESRQLIRRGRAGPGRRSRPRSRSRTVPLGQLNTATHCHSRCSADTKPPSARDEWDEAEQKVEWTRAQTAGAGARGAGNDRCYMHRYSRKRRGARMGRRLASEIWLAAGPSPRRLGIASPMDGRRARRTVTGEAGSAHETRRDGAGGTRRDEPRLAVAGRQAGKLAGWRADWLAGAAPAGRPKFVPRAGPGCRARAQAHPRPGWGKLVMADPLPAGEATILGARGALRLVAHPQNTNNAKWIFGAP